MADSGEPHESGRQASHRKKLKKIKIVHQHLASLKRLSK
jgi:hypothetical protein